MPPGSSIGCTKRAFSRTRATEMLNVAGYTAAMKPFSLQTLNAITEIVTGGSGADSRPSIGVYRSGPKLERFFGSLNLPLQIGSASRVPSVYSHLESVNRSEDGP